MAPAKWAGAARGNGRTHVGVGVGVGGGPANSSARTGESLRKRAGVAGEEMTTPSKKSGGHVCRKWANLSGKWADPSINRRTGDYFRHTPSTNKIGESITRGRGRTPLRNSAQDGCTNGRRLLQIWGSRRGNMRIRMGMNKPPRRKNENAISRKIGECL